MDLSLMIEIGNNQYMSPDTDDPETYHADGSICECYEECDECGNAYDHCGCYGEGE